MAQLGKYQLVAEIARGGMGIVYLAVARGPRGFSKLLVVKQLKPELACDATFLDMFLEEAKLAARLSHPNIVQTYEIGSDGGQHFIVMDYLEGVTLSRIVRRKSPSFTLPMHLRVIAEALRGLHHAHTLVDYEGTPLGLVHCDASPQNVFLTYDGQVKVVDFGIARALDAAIETTAGALKGKPSYMAPEQIAGDVDPRSDVFSAGAMIWEAVAGRRLWESRSDVEILTAVIRGEIPSLAAAAPDADPRLVRMVDKAMARSPDDRYATAAGLQEELEAYLTDALVDAKETVDVRDIAKVASEMFASERATTKAMIDVHLSTLARATSAAAALEPATEPERDWSGEWRTGRAIHESTHAPPLESSLTSGMGRTPPGTEVPTMPAPALFVPQRTWLLASSAMIVLIVVVGLVARVAGVARPAEFTAAAARPPSTTPIAALTHHVALRAEPADALVTIDGAGVGNPVKKACIHGHAFVVEVTAAGHVLQKRTVDCTRDEAIAVALEASASPLDPSPAAQKPLVRTPSSSSVPVPPAPAPPVVAPAAQDANSNHTIDPSSPYTPEP